MVGMANNGEPHTAASQFYIAANPLHWLDGKRVVFGKVRRLLHHWMAYDIWSAAELYSGAPEARFHS